MNRHRLRLGLIAAVALLLQATFAGSLAAQDATPAAEGVTVEQIAVVTPSSRTNQGWDQQAADAAEAVAAEAGIEAVVAENAGYDDITPVLRDLAAGGAGLIICHASGYQTVCPEFAAESGVPVAVIENPGAVAPMLVADIETQAQEVAYLAGVLAGETTESGTVGVVVSGEPPTWNYMTVGFAEGLAATNPDATMLYSVIGEAAYDDAAGASRVTEQQIAAGADVIFGMGDGASFGMIQAIEDHNAQDGASKVWFIDVIGDKRKIDKKGVLLSSELWDFAPIYTRAIKAVNRGKFGTTYILDAKNGLSLLKTNKAPASAWAKVAAAQKRIANRSIKVISTATEAKVKKYCKC